MKSTSLFQLFFFAAIAIFHSSESRAQCMYAFNEPNNSFTEFSTLSLNSNVRTGIGYNGDLDYYRVSVSNQGIWNITLTEVPLDYDLKVYSAGGNLIASSSLGGTNNESISINIIQPNYYYIRVEGYAGANGTSCYNLTNTIVVDDCIDSYEYNDVLSSAKAVSIGASVYAKISHYYDYDWYKITTTPSAKNLRVLLNNLVVDYDLYLYDSVGTLLAQSINGSSTGEQIKYNGPTAATYYIQVKSYVTGTSNRCYALNTLATSTPFAREADETENFTAKKVSGISMYPNPATTGQQVTININTEIDMVRILTINGEVLSEQKIVVENGEANIQLQGIEPGIYILDAGEAGKQKLIIQ